MNFQNARAMRGALQYCSCSTMRPGVRSGCNSTESDMAPKSFIPNRFEAAIDAFLAAHMGVVHREDVGPLFGQLALLRRETPADATVRKYWPEAICAALAPDMRNVQPQRVQWAHAVVAGTPRRTSPSADVPHARIRAGLRGARRASR